MSGHRVTPTRGATLVATRTVTIKHADGRRETITAGKDRIDRGHEFARTLPEAGWMEEPQSPGPVRAKAPAPAAPAERAQPRRPARTQMSLEEELHVRSARLRQIAADAEQARWTPRPPSGEELFWAGVADLLRDRKLEAEAAASEALLDQLDASRARALRYDRERLSAWLDTP